MSSTGPLVSSRRLAFLLFTAALLLAFASAGVASAPPSNAICATCTGDFDGQTGDGTITIELDENGDSTWIERIPVEAEAANVYRNDPALADRDVESAWADWHVVTDEYTDLETSVSDDEVVVRYDVEDVASRGVGDAWVVEYFYAAESTERHHVGGKSLTIEPPSDHVVTNHPAGGDVEDGVAVWLGEEPGPRTSDVPASALVTYGPEGDATASLASYATLGNLLGPTAIFQSVVGGVLPAFVLFSSAFVYERRPLVAGGKDRLVSSVSNARTVVVLGLGGMAIAPLVGFVFDGAAFGPSATALACGSIVYAGVGALLTREEVRAPTHVLALPVAAGALTAIVGLTAGLASIALLSAGLVGSAVGLLGIGYAVETRDRRHLFVAATTVLVGAVVATGAIVPTYPLGLAFGVLVFVLPASALAALAGGPLFSIGRKRGRTFETGPAERN